MRVEERLILAFPLNLKKKRLVDIVFNPTDYEG